MDGEKVISTQDSKAVSRWLIREPTSLHRASLRCMNSELMRRPAQAKEYASKMLGHKLITKQTGSGGRICNAVMLAERMPPQKEYYAAVLNDRTRGCPVLVTSSQGGMNIEDVAHDSPEAIITTPLNLEKGISHAQAVDLAKQLGFKGDQAQENAADVFGKLYTIFKEKDATQIEINPLAELKDGQVLWCVNRWLDGLALMTAAWTRNSGLMITRISGRRTSSGFEIRRKKILRK